MGKIREFPIPLVVAEAECRLVTVPRKRPVVVMLWNPTNYKGNTPGIQFRCALPAHSAVAFAVALNTVAQRMRGGEGLVEGQEYGRIPLELPGHATIFVFLTAEDCETISKVVQEAVAYARQRDLIVTR